MALQFQAFSLGKGQILVVMDRSFDLDQKSRRASPCDTVPRAEVLGLLRTTKIKKAASRLPRCESQKYLNELYHIFSRLVVKIQEWRLTSFQLARHPKRTAH
jgi:hypothetical protein